MTWREKYWNDATESPEYFEAAEFATVLDGDYGTRMFGRWLEEFHPDRHDLLRALEYLLVTQTYGDDVASTIDILERRLARPWDDWAMVAALEETARQYPGVPAVVRDDEDFTALAGRLRDDEHVFALWREMLQQASVEVLQAPEVVPSFVASCQGLAHETRRYVGVAGKEEESDDEVVASSSEKRVRFADPLVVGDEAPEWQNAEFQLGVAFTLNPESNSNLPGRCSWAQARVHLAQWGVDLDEFAELVDAAAQSRSRMYKNEQISVMLFPNFLNVTVTIDSALNAHNTGIIATLDSDGAYTHYVQFKDLVLFYTDESDMNTPIYNVLKTFGDLWADGPAESYVVRHGQGRKAYFTVTPVKASHQGSVVAVVKRCSGGLSVKVLT
ncbi:hypothetical protein AB0I61_17035 [Polymorphospora rubra]|uniref:hypothetical protein n=1 Tax=Polymorphospora rubra TaxID=338584 RepID=UPI0033F3E60E